VKFIHIALVLYLVGAVVTFGASNAHHQYECHHDFRAICDERMVRQDTAMSVVTALIPPFWISDIVITAGYEDGFSFTATPEIVR
jgi:hypothetical protein